MDKIQEMVFLKRFALFERTAADIPGHIVDGAFRRPAVPYAPNGYRPSKKMVRYLSRETK